jgi:hypothetical protein
VIPFRESNHREHREHRVGFFSLMYFSVFSVFCHVLSQAHDDKNPNPHSRGSQSSLQKKRGGVKPFRDNLSFVVIPMGTPQVAQSFYEKSRALNSVTSSE